MALRNDINGNAPGQNARPHVTGAATDRTLVTRRRFLYGAIGVGAAAAIGVGALALNRGEDAGDDVATLRVPESALTTLADLEVLETWQGSVEQIGSYDLPYGTLVWVNDDAYAACLLPTDKGSPLAQIGLLALGSGLLTTVREEAVGTKEHFEIYDVRASSAGMIWTEANILEGTWRIYGSKIEAGQPGEAVLLDEGDASYDTPSIAATATCAFWQVLPKPTDEPNDLKARLMKASFGSEKPTCLYESERRMGTPLYATQDSIVITPRLDTSGVYYQLTEMTEDGEVRDTLTLPASMTPLEAGYGRNGFMFSFSNIYDYGDGISNLGTYTPLHKPSGDYSAEKWFGFARTPTAAPAWCDDLLIVKSSYSVCGVDLEAGTYFAIDVDNGADTYGEYLASTGSHDAFVTFTNIDHEPVGEAAVKTCRVKVWRAVPAGQRGVAPDTGELEGEVAT